MQASWKTPVAGAITLEGVVSKYNKEGYGSRFEITLPTLFGGFGAVQDLSLDIGKKFTYKGKKQSLIVAKCPASKKLKGRVAVTLRSGATTTVPLTQSCKQKG